MIKKNLWIKNILGSLQRIANRDYQERAWRRNEVYYPCSFEEMMCKLFDDSCLNEFINEKADEFGLSLKQKTALSDFVYAIDKYIDNTEIYTINAPFCIDESKVLDDPEWHKIQKMAQKVLDFFGKIKYQPEDKEWWLQYILYQIAAYSNEDQQRRMWIDKSEIFWSTPLDMYECLYTGCEFDYFIDEYAQKFDLTEVQIVCLERFRSQLNKTPFKITNPENVLSNPDWQKLQVLAHEVLEVFEYSKFKN